MFDLVIFDCDGTLVNSEYLNNKVVADYLNALGFAQYTPDYAYRHFAGKTLEDIRIAVKADTGQTIPDDFTERYIEGVEASLAEFLEPVEQVGEVVAGCAERLNVCVASNGERPNVLSCLRIAGLAGLLPEEKVFTKDMVARGKPAPDLFLYAARQMGSEPSRALVIEDSVTGVTAGKAAGMTVVGFTGTAHDAEAAAQRLAAAGADIVFHRLAAIPDYIDRAAKLVSWKTPLSRTSA